jgi:dTDP-4-dehydrorhamnose reductase
VHSDRQLRIVVTGKNGQVARALSELASALGVIVVPLARPEFDLASTGEGLVATVKSLRPDVIVNAAAYTAVDRAETERDVALSVNAAGAGRIAEVAARLGVPIVQLSTDYVFDGSSTAPYQESHPTAPINFYGVSKLAGEAVVRAAAANHVILRTSWVYAPFGQNFVLTMLRLGAERPELAVVNDQHGAPTSAFDIARSIVAIAKRLVDSPEDPSIRGIFHMTNAGETTWAEFASEIFRLSEQEGHKFARVRPIPTSEYPTPAARPKSSRLDLTKLGDVFGIRPPHWKDALRETLRRLPVVETPLKERTR